MLSQDQAQVLAQRLVLIDGVTPVRRLAAVSAAAGRDVFVKQDDLTSLIYGGTKTRKLEFILHAAAGADARSLVTLGSWGSHHVIATALHARGPGLEVHAVVSPQPHSLHVDHSLHRCLEAGVVLHPANNELGMALAVFKAMRDLRRGGRKPFLVNLGGSSGPGVLGTVLAALELVAQVRRQEAPATGPIFVALGSGSTAAGLALGLVLAGASRPVRAIRVTSALVVNRFVLHRLLHAAAALLVAPKLRRALVKDASSLIEIDSSLLGKGYGWPTLAGDRALQLAASDGLALDPTYTAKVMAALLRPVDAGNPALYWHTLAAALPQPSGKLRLPSWLPARPSP